MSINCQSGNLNKVRSALAVIGDRQLPAPDFICVQETRGSLKDKEGGGIAGYALLAEATDANGARRGGVAILSRDATTVGAWTVSAVDEQSLSACSLEYCKVRLTCGDLYVLLCNANAGNGPALTQAAICAVAGCLHAPDPERHCVRLVMGDMNTHHPAWSAAQATQPRATWLSDALSAQQLSVLNDPDTATRFSIGDQAGSPSSPDIAAISGADAAWATVEVPSADHRAILVTAATGVSFTKVPGRRNAKFVVSTADWQKFAAVASERVRAACGVAKVCEAARPMAGPVT